MERLPVPDSYWTVRDFPALAEQAQILDESELRLFRSQGDIHGAVVKND
ncbi:hypothetical protein LPW36_07455 [Jinshanibacter sp. LJY008]|uniref:Uncharacterized protein n=1 Tax=Limnobaculum eriocheiris TaxID=2897391 RepID=A0A9X1SKE6_9GAMM|nr:hypothetical protein [Limnobaculum eriocheiris]MCD1125841.1 hypothetical protein [Limnobaculum eriocheiris]